MGDVSRSRWHLIAGSTGAGKTTYARRLADETRGVVFSIDEWMTTLFWPDCPRKDDLPWALERIRRCEEQAASVAGQLPQRNISAIFDMGLTTRALRERWIGRAQAAGVPVVLHVLDLPPAVRLQRVESRNATQGGTFAFHVTREMFDLVETMWQVPGADECAKYAEVFWRQS